MLGLHGGHPSPGVCRRCNSYDGPCRGLGDVVAMVARTTGVGAAFKALAGDGCGCGKRRAALNRAVPFKEGAD